MYLKLDGDRCNSLETKWGIGGKKIGYSGIKESNTFKMVSQGVEVIKLNQSTQKKKASAAHTLPRDLSM